MEAILHTLRSEHVLPVSLQQLRATLPPDLFARMDDAAFVAFAHENKAEINVFDVGRNLIFLSLASPRSAAAGREGAFELWTDYTSSVLFPHANAPTDGWSCELCTASNSAETGACSMCGTIAPKPAAVVSHAAAEANAALATPPSPMLPRVASLSNAELTVDTTLDLNEDSSANPSPTPSLRTPPSPIFFVEFGTRQTALTVPSPAPSLLSSLSPVSFIEFGSSPSPMTLSLSARSLCASPSPPLIVSGLKQSGAGATVAAHSEPLSSRPPGGARSSTSRESSVCVGYSNDESGWTLVKRTLSSATTSGVASCSSSPPAVQRADSDSSADGDSDFSCDRNALDEMLSPAGGGSSTDRVLLRPEPLRPKGVAMPNPAAVELRALLEKTPLSDRLYCRGYSSKMGPRALTRFVNSALCRALRTAEAQHILGALPICAAAQTACMLIFVSARIATAALELDGTLELEGEVLVLRRPQGWKPSVDAVVLQPLKVYLEPERDLAPPQHSSPSIKRANLSAGAKAANAILARAPAAAKAVKKKSQSVGASAPSVEKLDAEATARIVRVRTALKRDALDCLEILCSREKGGTMHVA